MTILFDIHARDWMSDDELVRCMGDVARHEIRFHPELGDPGEVVMLACDRLRPGLAARLPSLQLVQKLGVGVETMVYDLDLPPGVRLARLRADETAREMGRYCLGYVLEDMNNAAFFRNAQSQRQWCPKAPGDVAAVSVGVLGLGRIGGVIAGMFTGLGFPVYGWSRTQKHLDGVQCLCGEDGLDRILGQCDYVLCVLPATRETRNLFDLARFGRMKPGATLVNVGRGSLVVEDDLLAALDSGLLGHAVLDVFQHEPLAESSALWSHPRVTVTPHVSGWRVDSGLYAVRENYLRLKAGEPLLNEVDRALGY